MIACKSFIEYEDIPENRRYFIKDSNILKQIKSKNICYWDVSLTNYMKITNYSTSGLIKK